MRGISRLTITVQVLPRDGAGGEWRGAVGALPFEAPRRRRVRGEYAERRTRILARIGCWAGCPGRSGPATADRVADRGQRLAGLPGIDLLAPFGSSLHVGGADRPRLLASLAPFQGDAALAWREDPATLEDVFIHLMGGSADNFSTGSPP